MKLNTRISDKMKKVPVNLDCEDFPYIDRENRVSLHGPPDDMLKHEEFLPFFDSYVSILIQDQKAKLVWLLGQEFFRVREMKLDLDFCHGSSSQKTLQQNTTQASLINNKKEDMQITSQNINKKSIPRLLLLLCLLFLIICFLAIQGTIIHFLLVFLINPK